MASGFYTLQGNIIRNITRCIKHSTLNTTPCKVRWRSISTLTFNGFVDDTYPEIKKQENGCITLDRYTLKQKEKGDWRYLTFQEKQALYQMSFNHPWCDLEHADDDDEWKLILAGAFTAMGLMILGFYMFVFSSGPTEKAIGPLSAKLSLKEMEDTLKDKTV